MMKKFSMLELLVVIASIGILVSILLPSLLKSRLKTKTAVCMSNLKQNGTGFALYGKNNNQILPKRQYENQTSLGHHAYRRDDDYMGLGLLAKDEYVHGRVFYCPAREDEVTMDGNRIDIIPRYNKRQNRASPGCAGWDYQGRDKWRGDYDYRNSYEGRRMRLTDDGDLMLAADHWYLGFAKFYHQNQNVSVLYLGGHVSLVAIPYIDISYSNLSDTDSKITALFED